jgi:hypothetical protein
MYTVPFVVPAKPESPHYRHLFSNHATDILGWRKRGEFQEELDKVVKRGSLA